jgi:small-conductance mechanosensitive channel
MNFNKTIIAFNDFSITFGNILGVILFLLGVNILLRLIKYFLHKYANLDKGKEYSVYSLVKYIIYVFSFTMSLQILGYDVSLLIAGSAALLVGLGLGIQNLFSDYVSGVIILLDHSIKIGDVLEVNNIVCIVIDINLRTTLVLTRDDKYIILPNSDLTRNPLVNWTHNAVAARFEFAVGVAYRSDVEAVKRILKETAAQHPLILKNQEPFVRFEDFGDSALIFKLFFWSEEVFRVEHIKSDLRESINEAFKIEKIEIPFPQRVLHQSYEM